MGAPEQLDGSANLLGIRSAIPARRGTGAGGAVYLVGAGPGNPELLTLRAYNLLRAADAIVYDRLVNPEILALAKKDARRIYVGKETGKHTCSQAEISNLLVALARQGNRVVRLKGGDPFIFGRGGEEIETLTAHGIEFEVVPGVTAACGVAAFAGIPLTHRDYAQACVFVTGHLKDGSMNLDWQALCRPHQTVVVYMGLAGLPLLCEQLMAHGMPRSMPAAVVQHGTLELQRVVAGTLECLPERVQAAQLISPALTIVGEVVQLRDRLGWFEPDRLAQPLARTAAL